MITHAFAVFDKDTGTFATPFFQPHMALAIRAFKQIANDEGTTINRNPESFDLRYLGTFNDQTGELINDGPSIVATATGVVEPSKQSLLPFKDIA